MNAFALPGGYIYVYTGLMKEIDDEAQLAAVIAHEVGHVTARHATERLTSMYGYQFVVGLVLGKNPNAYAKLVADMVSTGGFLAYSRAERVRGGPSRREVPERGRLRSERHDRAHGQAQGYGERASRASSRTWLATHPPTSERLAEVEADVATLPKLASPVRNAAGYADDQGAASEIEGSHAPRNDGYSIPNRRA